MKGSRQAPFFNLLTMTGKFRIFVSVYYCAGPGDSLIKAELMANKILNEYSKGNTVAFWLTICIGIALILCIVWLFINYTAITF